jgi:hypothetical protein
MKARASSRQARAPAARLITFLLPDLVSLDFSRSNGSQPTPGSAQFCQSEQRHYLSKLFARGRGTRRELPCLRQQAFQ